MSTAPTQRTQQNSAMIPTQTQFLQLGLESCTPSSPVPSDLTCSICITKLREDEKVVKIIPCDNCYFHNDCITTWFISTHERRGTCPNDRTVLFQPDSIVGAAGAANNTDHTITEIRAALLNDMAVRFLERAINHHEHFLRSQEEALDADEIIDAWHTADDAQTLVASQCDVDWIRNEFPEDMRERSQPIADEMEADFNRLRDRYMDAIKLTTLAHVDNILAGIQELKDTFLDWLLDYIGDKLKYLVERAKSREWLILRGVLKEADALEQQIESLVADFTKDSAHEKPNSVSSVQTTVQPRDEDIEAMLDELELDWVLRNGD